MWGETALMMASVCEYERIFVIKELLDSSLAYANQQHKTGETVLMKAIKNGKVDIEKLLLARNANINLQDNHGETALIMAEQRGHQEIVEILVSPNEQKLVTSFVWQSMSQL